MAGAKSPLNGVPPAYQRKFVAMSYTKT
jgi:hypothetical protein